MTYWFVVAVTFMGLATWVWVLWTHGSRTVRWWLVVAVVLFATGYGMAALIDSSFEYDGTEERIQ